MRREQLRHCFRPKLLLQKSCFVKEEIISFRLISLARLTQLWVEVRMVLKHLFQRSQNMLPKMRERLMDLSTMIRAFIRHNLMKCHLGSCQNEMLRDLETLIE